MKGTGIGTKRDKKGEARERAERRRMRSGGPGSDGHRRLLGRWFFRAHDHDLLGIRLNDLQKRVAGMYFGINPNTGRDARMVSCVEIARMLKLSEKVVSEVCVMYMDHARAAAAYL